MSILLRGIRGVSLPASTIGHAMRLSLCSLVISMGTTPLLEVFAAPRAAPVAPATVHQRHAESAQADERVEHVTTQLVLKVLNRTQAQQQIIASINQIGGHLARSEHARLVLRIPPAKLDELLASLGSLGRIFDRQLSRRDVTEERLRLNSMLRSREVLFQRTRELMNAADQGFTLEVERKLRELLTEIERSKGQLRVLEDQIRYATLEISFLLPQQVPIERTRSPIVWLNQLGVEHVEQSF